MRLEAKANNILKSLDPLIAVAGKSADVTFRMKDTEISACVKDPATIAICVMNAYLDRGKDTGGILSYGGEGTVTVVLDMLASALRTFGDETVTVTVDGSLIIENSRAKRTIAIVDKTIEIREPNVDRRVSVSVSLEAILRASSLDKIAQSVSVSVSRQILTVKAASEAETAELFFDAETMDSAAASYPSEIFCAVVRRIRGKDDVLLDFAADSVLMIDHVLGCVEYTTYLAPRIME